MEVISVGSSSSGNSYIITTENSTVIIDVGLPAKRIITTLHQIGRSPEDVEAILITHEHVDHVRSVRAMGRQCPNALFYASKGTVENTDAFQYIDNERIIIVTAGEEIGMSEAIANTFPLSHDAVEPIGYTISADDIIVSVVTDCGVITDDIYNAVKSSDIILLEANHDENMLIYGEYPYSLKVRIKSDYGHLSNSCAGDALTRILDDRKKEMTGRMDLLRIMLTHLSFHNNAPYFARQTVEEKLEQCGYKKGDDYLLEIASKDEITVINCGD